MARETIGRFPEMSIDFLEPPLIREILEQQRTILRMHKILLEILSKPAVIVREIKDE